jgi:hypothetical protein
MDTDPLFADAGNKKAMQMIGRSIYQREVVPLRYTVTYQAVAGTALAQQINFNTSTVYASHPNFGVLISNLWDEYRVEKIHLAFTYTFNTALSGLYIPAVYSALFRGNTPPAISIAGISAKPWAKITSPPRKLNVKWHRPLDDPDAAVFGQTSAALPVSGGIVAYVGAAAPTSTVAYLVIDVVFLVSVRGRKV